MTGWMLFLVVAAGRRRRRGPALHVDAIVMRGRRGGFPLGILIVNVTGSFALGVRDRARIGDRRRAGRRVSASGLLGGYTTFSAVSVETVLLGRGGRRDWAVAQPRRHARPRGARRGGSAWLSAASSPAGSRLIRGARRAAAHSTVRY